jgi:hypothetical protein
MLAKLLHFLVPAAEFVIVGDPQNETDYAEKVRWLDKKPQPSWQQILDAKPAFEKQLANDQAKANRAAAYSSEADPLFFGWQRNENTEQAWLDKVAEVRARYPYTA